jgi:beta-mannanase
LEGLYPGDDYVDWTCMDGYNWGTDHGNSGWWSLTDVFAGSIYTGRFNTYRELLTLAPDKPVMIGETGSSEHGGSKAAWISSALGVELFSNFPSVKAFIWFNSDSGDPTLNWAIDSSPEAQAAFAEAIADPAYASSTYGNLAVAPIPPPDVLAASP